MDQKSSVKRKTTKEKYSICDCSTVKSKNNTSWWRNCARDYGLCEKSEFNKYYVSRKTARCYCRSYTKNKCSTNNSQFRGCSCNYMLLDNQTAFSKMSIKAFGRSESSYETMTVANEVLFSGVNSRTRHEKKQIRQEIQTNVQAILCPQLIKTHDDKMNITLDTSSRNQIIIKNNLSMETNQDGTSSNTNFVERKVCDVVKKLMKDITVNPEELNKDQLLSSDLEWITLENLFKRVISLTKLNHSDDTLNKTVRKNTKHLKADFGQFCDKSTGTQLQYIPIKVIQRKFAQVQKSRNIATGHNEDASVSKIPISRNVCFKRQSEVNLCTYDLSKSGANDDGRIPRQDTDSKYSKIAIENNEGRLGNQLTSLTKTGSGKLALELDEEVIQLIENAINDNPNAFVSLTRSESGHIAIVFDIKSNEVFNDQRVTLRRTPSGTRLLRMYKGLVEKIQGDKQKNPQIDLKDTRNIREQKDIQNECKFKSQRDNSQCSWRHDDECEATNKNLAESSTCCPIPSAHVQLGKNYGRDQNSKNALSEYFNILNSAEYSSVQAQNSLTSISWISEASKKAEIENPLLDYSHEIQKLYERGNLAVTFQIETKKALFKQFETVISKSLSGTISADLLNKSPLERIPLDELYPVCLTKTISGTFLVTVDSSSRMFNAVIRKRSPGNVVLIPKNPQTKTKHKLNTFSDGQKFFKLKVSGYNNHLIALPAVLKLTSSENYIIILDKEFEKRYKQTVHDYVGKERECFVYLQKVGSSYILNLNTAASIPPEELNALLVKSRSGNIKILVHGHVFERIDSSTSKRSSMSSAQVFGELLGELKPASSRKIHRKEISKRTCSDSQLHERVNIKLQINKDMFTEPSAILKKSDSGQYAIILNEKYKNCFINYLRSYLTRNPRGLVPVKRLDSGQILIVLDSEVEGEGYYGSLKITSSGNIYVTVDAEALKRLNDNPNKNNKSSKMVEALKKLNDNPNKNNKSSKMVDIRPYDYGTVNKAVTTTCNAKPDNCECDTSQCVCAELKHETIDWVEYGKAISRDGVGRLRQPMCWMKAKSCTDQQGSEARSMGTSNVIDPRPKSPHIIIRPATEYPPSNLPFRSTENCFYVIDTVCQYHKNRYDAVSNELLEISGLCNKGQKAPTDSIELTSNNVDSDLPLEKVSETWDSLSYLPPQLPSFLCNIRYR